MGWIAHRQWGLWTGQRITRFAASAGGWLGSDSYDLPNRQEGLFETVRRTSG